MGNSKNRIPKTIRLNPAIDKDIDTYCLLTGSSQADYINKALAEDLDKRTLRRFAFKESIFINLPMKSESIADCIENKIDLRKFEYEKDYSKIGFKLNNFLDVWNGETFAKPNFNYIHSGINILDFNDTTYYVYTQFYFGKYEDRVINEKRINMFQTVDAKDFQEYIDKEYDNATITAPYIFDAEKVFIDKIILMTKEDAINYAYLSKNGVLIETLKNDAFSNDSDLYSNPASDIAEYKQLEKGRELEKTKNQLRDAKRQLNEQKVIVSALQEELETLKRQNNQLIEDNEKLDKAIADAVNMGYEKARQDFNDYLDKTLEKYGF